MGMRARCRRGEELRGAGEAGSQLSMKKATLLGQRISHPIPDRRTRWRGSGSGRYGSEVNKSDRFRRFLL